LQLWPFFVHGEGEGVPETQRPRRDPAEHPQRLCSSHEHGFHTDSTGARQQLPLSLFSLPLVNATAPRVFPDSRCGIADCPDPPHAVAWPSRSRSLQTPTLPAALVANLAQHRRASIKTLFSPGTGTTRASRASPASRTTLRATLPCRALHPAAQSIHPPSSPPASSWQQQRNNGTPTVPVHYSPELLHPRLLAIDLDLDLASTPTPTSTTHRHTHPCPADSDTAARPAFASWIRLIAARSPG